MNAPSVPELCRGYLRKIQKKALLFNKAYGYARHPRTWMERVRLGSEEHLSAEEKGTLATLRRENFHRADQLVDPGLLAELMAEAAPRLASAGEARRSNNKAFIGHLLPRNIEAESIYVRFALQENILRLVGAYFGESPFLRQISVIASFGSEAAVWQDSQLWHQDHADSKILKLWTYLTDVRSQADGPFTYLPGHKSRDVPNPFQHRVSDQTMADLGFEPQTVAVTGPKSTSFLIDTRNCYHQGSRVEEGHLRVAFVANYVSFASLSSSRNEVQGRGRDWSRRQYLAIKKS
jgi:hypothetical protein